MAVLMRASQRDAGQALVECLVLALVLLPLFIAVPLIGKVLDLSQHAVAASRYAAFEANVRHSSAWGSWKSDADLSREVRRRFFSASTAPVKSGDAAGDFAAHRNPVWTDRSGRPLLGSFARQVDVHATQRVFLQPAGASFARDLSLPQDNLHRARVAVRSVRMLGLDVGIEWTTSLLVDPWSVADGDRVGQKIHESTQAFPARAGIRPVAAAHAPWLSMMAEELRPHAGLVRPDVIPPDRLGPYR
jgi:hypothetical protein